MEDYIWVITDDNVSTGARAGSGLQNNPYTGDTLSTPADTRSGIPVSAEKLERGMAEFLGTMGRVIKQAQKCAIEVGSMELDEIELSVEVNGEGQLSLLGSGTRIGAKGAMTLHFKRASASET